MSPESIIAQSKKAKIAQQCGFVSYVRDDEIKKPVVPEVYFKDKQRTERVANYLASIFINGAAELELHPSDRRSKPVVAYMAYYALKEYGFQTASILNVREAVTSDLYTEAAIGRINSLKKERAAINGTHLVVADCRVPKLSIAQERRFDAIYEATQDSGVSDTYRAIIPAQPRIEIVQPVGVTSYLESSART